MLLKLNVTIYCLCFGRCHSFAIRFFPGGRYLLLGYAEIHGTGGPDSLRAFHGHAIYAGPDNDTITLSANTHAYLMGGDHNDTYVLHSGSYAVILDSRGHDTISFPFSIKPYSTFVVTVDEGRHSLVGDLLSGTMVCSRGDQPLRPLRNRRMERRTKSLRNVQY